MYYFSSNIKYLRKVHRLTQQQLGDIFGKDFTTISTWELGKRSPILADAISIANYFNVSVSDLIEKDLSIESPLSAKEDELLDAFRKLSADQQDAIIITMKAMVK